jgi:hypothetical protein
MQLSVQRIAAAPGRQPCRASRDLARILGDCTEGGGQAMHRCTAPGLSQQRRGCGGARARHKLRARDTAARTQTVHVRPYPFTTCAVQALRNGKLSAAAVVAQMAQMEQFSDGTVRP